MRDLKGRHLLTVEDFDQDEIDLLYASAKILKQRHQRGIPEKFLAGKTLALIFEKASMRTRVSFETAMRQLGNPLTCTALRYPS